MRFAGWHLSTVFNIRARKRRLVLETLKKRRPVQAEVVLGQNILSCEKLAFRT